MKKFFILSSLLFASFCFSQSVTKKYNPYQKQYEYYDSSGNMIAYERYNSYSKQWEFYDLKTSKRQPYQYRNPAPVDISSLGNAATALQNRYNNNQARIQSTLDYIVEKLDNISKTEEERKYIKNLFTEKCVKKSLSLDFKLSSDYQTQQWIDFLYDCINNQLKNQ